MKVTNIDFLNLTHWTIAGQGIDELPFPTRHTQCGRQTAFILGRNLNFYLRTTVHVQQRRALHPITIDVTRQE
jgi:hypothetical protein